MPPRLLKTEAAREEGGERGSRRLSNFCLTLALTRYAQPSTPNPSPNDRQAAAKIQAVKRGQRDRAEVAMMRSPLLRLLQACTAPLQKCVPGLRAMFEGVQDGSSAAKNAARQQ